MIAGIEIETGSCDPGLTTPLLGMVCALCELLTLASKQEGSRQSTCWGRISGLRPTSSQSMLKMLDHFYFCFNLGNEYFFRGCNQKMS